MTAVTWRTITSHRREWFVPAAQPWGACLGDMKDGIALAATQWRVDHNVAEEVALADDALRFHLTDDEIVISYVIEERETALEAARRDRPGPADAQQPRERA